MITDTNPSPDKSGTSLTKGKIIRVRGFVDFEIGLI